MIFAQEPGHRAGFVALVGPPNAGKSTLLNRLMNFPLAITSPRHQTTRQKISGILNGEKCQAVFLDTPGFLSPRNAFEKSMCSAIKRSILDDSDIICLLCAHGEKEILPEYLAMISTSKKIRFLVVNKLDISGRRKTEEVAEKYSGELKPTRTFFISALKGTGVEELKSAILNNLPYSPPYYPKEQITPQWERFFAAEIVRQVIFETFSSEIPYRTAVELDIFNEGKNRPDYLHANIHVSKNSLKPIVIGKRGSKLKMIREEAQALLQKFFMRKVKLEISVKVTKDWENKPQFLKTLNYE